MLDEASRCQLPGSLGRHQKCFTLEQWREIKAQSGEDIGWFEADAGRRRA
jgi:hypothetical protein